MRRGWKAMTAGALGLVLAGTAIAQPAPGGRRGRGPERMMEALELTDAQKEKVRPLLDEQRDAARANRERMRSEREALRKALEAEKPDATAVGQAMLRMKAGRETAKAQRQAFHAKLAKVLTPEQNAKLEGFVAGLRAGRGVGRGPGRGGMGRGGFGPER